MNAEIKNILLIDDFSINFKDYIPENIKNFNLNISLEIGAKDEEWSNIFEVEILNELDETRGEVIFTYDDILFFKSKIVIQSYSYSKIIQAINQYISICSGEGWDNIAVKLSQVFNWEYENYTQLY